MVTDIKSFVSYKDDFFDEFHLINFIFGRFFSVNAGHCGREYSHNEFDGVEEILHGATVIAAYLLSSRSWVVTNVANLPTSESNFIFKSGISSTISSFSRSKR